MKGSWQIVSDPKEERGLRSSPSADLRGLGVLALVTLLVAASTALILDRSSPTSTRTTQTATTTRSSPQILPSATPLSFPTATRPGLPAGALAAGTYALPNPDPECFGGCAGYRRIVFTLPAGWATSGRLVYKHLNQSDEVSFSAWTVNQVYDDPCHWRSSTQSQLDADHIIAYANGELVLEPYSGGLANQRSRGAGPHALTQMTFAAVDQYGVSWPVKALRVDLSVPAVLDVSHCDNGEFRSWTGFHTDGFDSHNASGQVDLVYMLNLDRRALVIDASHMPGASSADLAELDAVIASMVVER